MEAMALTSKSLLSKRAPAVVGGRRRRSQPQRRWSSGGVVGEGVAKTGMDAGNDQ